MSTATVMNSSKVPMDSSVLSVNRSKLMRLAEGIKTKKKPNHKKSINFKKDPGYTNIEHLVFGTYKPRGSPLTSTLSSATSATAVTRANGCAITNNTNINGSSRNDVTEDPRPADLLCPWKDGGDGSRTQEASVQKRQSLPDLVSDRHAWQDPVSRLPWDAAGRRADCDGPTEPDPSPARRPPELNDLDSAHGRSGHDACTWASSMLSPVHGLPPSFGSEEECSDRGCPGAPTVKGINVVVDQRHSGDGANVDSFAENETGLPLTCEMVHVRNEEDLPARGQTPTSSCCSVGKSAPRDKSSKTSPVVMTPPSSSTSGNLDAGSGVAPSSLDPGSPHRHFYSNGAVFPPVLGTSGSVVTADESTPSLSNPCSAASSPGVARRPLGKNTDPKGGRSSFAKSAAGGGGLPQRHSTRERSAAGAGQQSLRALAAASRLGGGGSFGYGVPRGEACAAPLHPAHVSVQLASVQAVRKVSVSASNPAKLTLSTRVKVTMTAADDASTKSEPLGVGGPSRPRSACGGGGAGVPLAASRIGGLHSSKSRSSSRTSLVSTGRQPVVAVSQCPVSGNRSNARAARPKGTSSAAAAAVAVGHPVMQGNAASACMASAGRRLDPVAPAAPLSNHGTASGQRTGVPCEEAASVRRSFHAASYLRSCSSGSACGRLATSSSRSPNSIPRNAGRMSLRLPAPGGGATGKPPLYPFRGAASTGRPGMARERSPLVASAGSKVQQPKSGGTARNTVCRIPHYKYAKSYPPPTRDGVVVKGLAVIVGQNEHVASSTDSGSALEGGNLAEDDVRSCAPVANEASAPDCLLAGGCDAPIVESCPGFSGMESDAERLCAVPGEPSDVAPVPGVGDSELQERSADCCVPGGAVVSSLPDDGTVDSNATEEMEEFGPQRRATSLPRSCCLSPRRRRRSACDARTGCCAVACNSRRNSGGPPLPVRSLSTAGGFLYTCATPPDLTEQVATERGRLLNWSTTKTRRENWNVDKLEEFIEAVQKYEVLYNKRHKEFKNIPMKKAMWAAIGDQFSCSGDDASKKWSIQRDRYHRDRNLMLASHAGGGHGASEVYTPKWKLYNVMDNVLQGFDHQTFETASNVSVVTQITDSAPFEHGAFEDMSLSSVSDTESSAAAVARCSTPASSEMEIMPPTQTRKRQSNRAALAKERPATPATDEAFPSSGGDSSKKRACNDHIALFCRRLEVRMRMLNKRDLRDIMHDIDNKMYALEEKDIYLEA